MQEPRGSEGVRRTRYRHLGAVEFSAPPHSDQTDMTQNLNINDSDRVTLSEVMDRLIPSVDDLAAAGQMGLGPEVERMANDVARYANALESFVGALSADPLSRAAGGFRALSPEEQDNAIRVIEKNIPAEFGTFLEIVYLAYYSQPAVHRRIGWVGRPPQPEGFDLPPFDESILETVRKREPFWRKTDDQGVQ